jgi:hypothetical protein
VDKRSWNNGSRNRLLKKPQGMTHALPTFKTPKTIDFTEYVEVGVLGLFGEPGETSEGGGEILHPTWDENGNVIGSVIRIKRSEFVKKLAPSNFQAKKEWRDSVLSFDGNKATFRWKEGASTYEALTDLEPCVLGSVVSLSDEKLVFKTDRGIYTVSISSKKEGERLLYRNHIDRKDGSSKTLNRLLFKSWRKWGDWGGQGFLWRASSALAVPGSHLRPRWRLSRWWIPGSGCGIYIRSGEQIRTGNDSEPVEGSNAIPELNPVMLGVA